MQIHFISASCENMIDGRGMLPGDVLTASNGKTVEVSPGSSSAQCTALISLLLLCITSTLRCQAKMVSDNSLLVPQPRLSGRKGSETVSLAVLFCLV